MWALRAAVRGGTWLSRAVRGCRPPRAALLPPPPHPERAVAALRGGLGCSDGREGRGRSPRADGRRSLADAEEEPEDAEEDEDEEELLRTDPLLPAGAQRVCLVHPEVKWGRGKPQGTRGDQERWGQAGAGAGGARRLDLKGRGSRRPGGGAYGGDTPGAGARRSGTPEAGLLERASKALAHRLRLWGRGSGGGDSGGVFRRPKLIGRAFWGRGAGGGVSGACLRGCSGLGGASEEDSEGEPRTPPLAPGAPPPTPRLHGPGNPHSGHRRPPALHAASPFPFEPLLGVALPCSPGASPSTMQTIPATHAGCTRDAPRL